jgi:hypothetical protein
MMTTVARWWKTTTTTPTAGRDDECPITNAPLVAALLGDHDDDHRSGEIIIKADRSSQGKNLIDRDKTACPRSLGRLPTYWRWRWRDHGDDHRSGEIIIKADRSSQGKTYRSRQNCMPSLARSPAYLPTLISTSNPMQCCNVYVPSLARSPAYLPTLISTSNPMQCCNVHVVS